MLLLSCDSYNVPKNVLLILEFQEIDPEDNYKLIVVNLSILWGFMVAPIIGQKICDKVYPLIELDRYEQIQFLNILVDGA